MNSSTVVVVILNWKQPEETIACIASLNKQSYANLQLVVVDNHSCDNSVEKIKKIHPNVHIIENARNAGFAGGMNLGIKWGLENKAKWLFVINNDTFFAHDVIEKLIANADQSTGLLAPIIYYAEEQETVWSYGGVLKNTLLEVNDIGRGVIDRGNLPKIMSVDFVPGCAMLLSESALHQVGLFDERFFMYYEDSDLCLRLRRAGYKIITVTSAKMWHKVAVSSGGADSPNERYWMAHSSVLFFAKYCYFPQIILIIFWRLASALRTSVRLIKHTNPKALRAYWRGLWDGLRELP